MSLPCVLFVCVENSNRSQIAEAFARMHGGDVVDAVSAGSRPSRSINPRAVASMRRRGSDLTQHSSKGLDEVPDEGYAAVVTMGCGDACPWLPAENRGDWEIPDRREFSDEDFDAVRGILG
jgi:arsenate reductase (thioredoxin)